MTEQIATIRASTIPIGAMVRNSNITHYSWSEQHFEELATLHFGRQVVCVPTPSPGVAR